MAEGELVRFEKDGDIGVITIDNPPVNALSPGVPEGIISAVDRGNADPAVKAMVLIGAGRSFIAGADIRQFGKGPSRPASALTGGLSTVMTPTPSIFSNRTSSRSPSAIFVTPRRFTSEAVRR